MAFPSPSSPFRNLVLKSIPFLDRFFRKSGSSLGSHFFLRSPEMSKNRVWKAIPIRVLFLDRFWIGFSWKMKAFWKAAEAIIYYKNSSFSVFSVFASKTAPGPPRDQFWPPERAPFSNPNRLMTLPGLLRRGSKNGSRFWRQFMLIFGNSGPPIWDPKSL